MIGPRLIDKLLVLYGYGNLGRLADEILKEIGIPVYGVIDQKCHSQILDELDKKIVNRQDFLLAICVATESYNQVIAPLIAAGWTDIVPIWDIIEAYPEVGIRNGWFVGELPDEEMFYCRDILKRLDHESQIHYRALWDWHSRHTQDTMYPLVIEPMDSLPSTLADIRQRQRVITFADTPLIRAVCIHAEGCELKALEVNMHIFQKYRPSIECACYHSRDGLWKIEKFLIGNLPDYRWTFRLHAYMGQSAYICGMPKERL